MPALLDLALTASGDLLAQYRGIYKRTPLTPSIANPMLKSYADVAEAAADPELNREVAAARDEIVRKATTYGHRAALVRRSPDAAGWDALADVTDPVLSRRDIRDAQRRAEQTAHRVSLASQHGLLGGMPLQALAARLRTGEFVTIGTTAPGPRIHKADRKQREVLQESDMAALRATYLLLTATKHLNTSSNMVPYAMALAVFEVA